MKYKYVSASVLAVLLLLTSQVCEGPAGPAGVDGIDGVDGVDATGLPSSGTYFSLAVNNNAGDMQFGSFVNYLAFSDTDATVAGTTIPQVLSVETEAPPEIDGVAVTGEWPASGTIITLERITDFEKYDGISPVGVTSVTVKSMYDETFVYFQLTWDDAAEDFEKAKLSYAGSTDSWSSSGNEDRFYFMFPIKGFEGSDYADGNGCDAFCHYDETSANGKGYMFTESEGQLVDTWQWKASRGNPVGFIHDKHLVYRDSVAFNASTDKPKSFSGRKGDQGQNTYVENKLSGGVPTYMHVNDPNANAAYPSMVWDMVPFDNTATFTDGATIPGVFLRIPSGSGADVNAVGKHSGSGWLVEVQRVRNTGHGDDHEFIPEHADDHVH